MQISRASFLRGSEDYKRESRKLYIFDIYFPGNGACGGHTRAQEYFQWRKIARNNLCVFFCENFTARD